MTKPKITVRVNSSHDGLRAGKEYQLNDTADVRRRIEAGRLTLVEKKKASTRSKAEDKSDEEVAATDGE